MDKRRAMRIFREYMKKLPYKFEMDYVYDKNEPIDISRTDAMVYSFRELRFLRTTDLLVIFGENSCDIRMYYNILALENADIGDITRSLNYVNTEYVSCLGGRLIYDEENKWVIYRLQILYQILESFPELSVLDSVKTGIVLYKKVNKALIKFRGLK